MIEILRKEDCCGCSACVSICNQSAIEFKQDEEGFLYPIINKDNCVNCGLCDKVCPLKRRLSDPQMSSTVTVKEYYALRHKNKDILDNSSSGGAFSLIAEYVLKKKGVVCGVEYSSDGVVHHAFAENLKDLKKFRGSKYAQSDIRGTYQRYKEVSKG